MSTKDYIIDFEQLYDSMQKCKRGVMWKPSVKSFVLNDIENLLRMEKKLKNGTWQNGEPKPIKIYYPKHRDGLSISFKDRVYQRSVNDNELYPKTTNSFIYDNWACQVGKGTDKARNRMKEMLKEYFRKYGNQGYVLQTDIKGYFPNMSHLEVKSCFKKYLDINVYDMACEILDTQYKGDVGYNPGSQMVQIAGITFLNEIDHFIKEDLHEHFYLRYMDDKRIISNDRERLEKDLLLIGDKLNDIGCSFNKNKTKITKLSDGFMFLGFKYRLTNTGKVIMTVDPKNVKHERKRLRKMVAKCKRGEMTRSKVDECYKSWKAHVAKGNSYKLLLKLDKYYYEELWGEKYESY